MIANHTAVAIANARSFDEVAALKRRLEEECEYLRQEVREANAFGEIIGRSPAVWPPSSGRSSWSPPRTRRS